MPWLRRMLRAVACVLLLGTSTLVTAQPAAAASSGWKTVHTGLTTCLRASASITRWIPGTFSGNHATADSNLFSRNISGACINAASGTGRVKVYVEFYPDASSPWIGCRESGYAYGDFGWRGGEFPGPYGPSVLLDYGGAVCGAGWYRARASAEYLQGRTWVPAPVVYVSSPEIWVD